MSLFIVSHDFILYKRVRKCRLFKIEKNKPFIVEHDRHSRYVQGIHYIGHVQNKKSLSRVRGGHLTSNFYDNFIIL